MRTPKPVSRNVVCSECGLPWGAHENPTGAAVTLETCVVLLKAELASRRRVPLASFGSSRVGAGVVNPMYPVSR